MTWPDAGENSFGRCRADYRRLERNTWNHLMDYMLTGRCELVEQELAARHPIRLSVTQNTVEVTLKEDHGGILAFVAALATRGRVLRLEVGGASLEDIFVELTKEGTS